MNRKNIKKVRDVIAALPRKRFNMEYYAAIHDTADECGDDIPAVQLTHTCNTAGCIAGWTVATFATRNSSRHTGQRAKNLLGITEAQSHNLFAPPGYDEPGRFSQAHAVRVLDHLLETGKVDWKSTRRAKKAVAK